MNTVQLIQFRESQVAEVRAELSKAAAKVGEVMANIYEPCCSLNENEKTQALADALHGISVALIEMTHPVKEQEK